MQLTCVADESGNTYTFSHGIREIMLPKGYRINIGEQSDSLTVEQWQEPWTGEGLPPVGTVCEWFDSDCGRWLKVSIAYVSNWVIVLRDSKPHPDGSVEIAKDVSSDPERCPKFRIIRTPEQIATEERNSAQKEIKQIILSMFNIDASTASGIAGVIADSNYRKQVTK